MLKIVDLRQIDRIDEREPGERSSDDGTVRALPPARTCLPLCGAVHRHWLGVNAMRAAQSPEAKSLAAESSSALGWVAAKRFRPRRHPANAR